MPPDPGEASEMGAALTTESDITNPAEHNPEGTAAAEALGLSGSARRDLRRLGVLAARSLRRARRAGTMPAAEAGPEQVFVRGFAKTVVLDVEPNATVDDVRLAACAKLGVDAVEGRIVAPGRAAPKGSAALAACGIRGGTTLDLVPCLRGGAPEACPGFCGSFMCGLWAPEAAAPEVGDTPVTQPGDSLGTESHIATYNTYDILNEAMQGGRLAPIAFIKFTYLRKLRDQRKRIPARQLLPEDAIFKGTIDAGVHVLVLSYCWAARWHPDANYKLLDDVCTFGDFLIESSGRAGGIKVNTSEKLTADTLLLFWDYPSMHQDIEERRRTADETQAFTKGLKGFINALYAHTLTHCLICSHAYRNLQYRDSGWPYFEFAVSQLAKATDQVTDLPAALKWLDRGRHQFDVNRNMEAMRIHVGRAARGLAPSPDLFDVEIAHKTVTNGSDKEFLKSKYRETWHHIVRSNEELRLPNMQKVTSHQWLDVLENTLRVADHLRVLDLSQNEAIDAPLAVFSVCKQLRELDLSQCPNVSGSLQMLGALRSLVVFRLKLNDRVTGDVAALCGLKSLEEVQIVVCPGITGDAAEFAQLPSLQALDVRGSVGILSWDVMSKQQPSLFKSALGPATKLGVGDLCDACALGLTVSAKNLVAHGVNVNGRMGELGGFPWQAAAFGQAEPVQALWNLRSTVDQGELGGFPWQAAAFGQAEPVQALRNLRSTVDQGELRRFPLRQAAIYGQAETVQALLSLRATVDQVDSNGSTALKWAVSHGHLDCAEALVRSSADVNKASGRVASTPLGVASEFGDDRSVVRFLVEKKANINQANKERITPIFMAAKNGNSRILQYLIESNGDVNKASENNVTPLNIGADYGHVKVVELLLDAKADKDKVDRWGDTALSSVQKTRSPAHDKVARLLQGSF